MITNTQPGDIVFIEEPHEYYVIIDNQRIPMTSVTTVIHKYFKEFVEEEVLDKMVACGTIKLDEKQKTLDDWNTANREGSLLHLAIENYILGNPADHFDLHRFLYFWDSRQFTQKGYTSYPEFRVYDLDINLSGTIDCILTNEDGKFIILDWKRCKSIYKTSPSNAKPPFESLPDCKFSQYSLQLNFYRTIITRKYKINNRQPQCIGMFLVVFEPNQPGIVVEKVDYIPMSDMWYNIV